MACGQIDGDMAVMDNLNAKLHAMFNTLQEVADKPELMMAATQLLSLIVCHSPPAFWQVSHSRDATPCACRA